MNISLNTPFEALPQFLTPEEFRILARIGRSTIYDAIQRGEIPVVRFGRALRISRNVVQKYLNGDGHVETHSGEGC